MQLTPTVQQGYLNLWRKANVRPEHVRELNSIAEHIIAHRAQYEAVEKATGVPWYWVGIVHVRESNADFNTYLGNGEPLNRVTHLVPRGRGPFASWQDGAIDALKYQGLDRVKDWSIPSLLYWFEAFNGWGYVSKGINSPYVWSFTDLYSHGKYIADGVFSSSAADPQPGAAAMLKTLITLIPNLIAGAVSSAVTPTTPSSQKNVPSAGVTISTSQNLATHLLAAVGAIIAASGIPALHSVYDLLTSSTFLGGTIVSVLAAAISQINVIGANENTLKVLDKIIVDITPQHQSLLQQAAKDEVNTASMA